MMDSQRRFRRIPAALSCLGWLLLTGWAAPRRADLTVSHRARSLQPGEVVLLAIDSIRPLRQVSASAFGREFRCFAEADPLKWTGLIGIDLDIKPGRYPVRISALESDGKTLTSEYPLVIIGKNFPTRKLTVDEKFVSPPAAEQPRIQKEAERVAAIFSAVSLQRYWSGSFLLPVPGAPISEFGKRSIYNGQPRSPHAGTDFAGAAGTPIKAPNAGVVVLAADLYYSGGTVILDHGLGLYSYFGHMSAIAVREGERVAAGDVVGKVGATGLVTGPHLHWSVRLAGSRVDPLSLVYLLGENSQKANLRKRL